MFSVEPTETAFNSPASQRNHEAFLRLRWLGHLQLNAFVAGRRCSAIPGVALIRKKLASPSCP